MDKTLLLTLIIGGSLVYFKQFLIFTLENIKNLLITSLKIEESSYFFYSFQSFVLNEMNKKVNKDCFWLG